MTKKLSDFTLECNLNGWHCKKKSSEVSVYVGGNAKFYRAGQKFTGDQISQRMVEACENPVDTFVDKKTGKKTQVLTIMGGTAKELRDAFDKRQAELKKKFVNEVVVPEPTPEPNKEEKEEKKEEKEKKEPKRTPRPK